ncbi:MAG: hypothetical protein KAJ12_13725, partial [Bacteroidetes bacterium]|nr:hypothetical protein [Bacteroidota bacterium]
QSLKRWVCYQAMNFTGGTPDYPRLLYRAVRMMLQASEKKRVSSQIRWLWTCLNGSNGSPPWVHLSTAEDESTVSGRGQGSVKSLPEALEVLRMPKET